MVRQGSEGHIEGDSSTRAVPRKEGRHRVSLDDECSGRLMFPPVGMELR